MEIFSKILNNKKRKKKKMDVNGNMPVYEVLKNVKQSNEMWQF